MARTVQGKNIILALVAHAFCNFCFLLNSLFIGIFKFISDHNVFKAKRPFPFVIFLLSPTRAIYGNEHISKRNIYLPPITSPESILFKNCPV